MTGATARFKKIVQEKGQPESLLLFGLPGKDTQFQTAVKTHRIMSIWLHTLQNKTEFGEVGYHPGKNMAYLRFPKSLQAYEGKRIIGIDWDQIKDSTALGKVVRKTSPREKPAKPIKKSFTLTVEKIKTLRLTIQVEATDQSTAEQKALKAAASRARWQESSTPAKIVDIQS